MSETVTISNPNPTVTVVHEKLVRDKIVNLVSPKTFSFRTAEEREMPEFLALKIKEEALELAEAVFSNGRDYVSDREKVLEEAADLLEVLYTVAGRFDYSQADVHQAAFKKRIQKGAFRNRSILIQS